MSPVLLIQDLAVILVAATIFGFLCRRFGLSPILGYLLAGLIIGTPEITFPYVTDEDRLTAISLLGLVFLMFSIGLQFRLRRIREMGFPIVIATFLIAMMIFTVFRWGAGMAGLSPEAGLCLAAIFMVSSSAVIGKVLQESHLSHQRFGQIALGITLMEDIVAVILLAVLGSVLGQNAGTGEGIGILGTIGLVIGFALVLLVGGFLIFPRLLRWSQKWGTSELVMVLVVGVLLALALLADNVGYSLALGAFLFGIVISETRQRTEVERSFAGLKHVFLTIFFVAIGMQVEVATFPLVWHWIVLGALMAILGRAVFAYIALLLICERPRSALSSALCLTPIGEFSFVIAGIAVAGGLMPSEFQTVAVGVAILTSLVSPVLATRGDLVGQWIGLREEPGKPFQAYQKFWQEIRLLSENSSLWRMVRRRTGHILLEVLLASALVVFARPVSLWLTDFVATHYDQKLLWVEYVVLALAFGVFLPLAYSIGRNLNALLLMIGEFAEKDFPDLRAYGPALRSVLLAVVAFGLLLWWWNLLPIEWVGHWVFPIVLLLVGVAGVVFRRRMIYWHSQFRDVLEETVQGEEEEPERLFAQITPSGWNIEVEESILPDSSKWAGKTIQATALRNVTGASIVGLERQGYALESIGPSTHLFPGDRILILGTDEQRKKAMAHLGQMGDESQEEAGIGDLVLENLVVEEKSKLVGQTLADLEWPLRYGVQVVGLERKGEKHTTPGARTVLEEGDQLLLLGRSPDCQRLRQSV
ncbi:MAG: cation:proton antiporter [Opitutales bacterium]|nr:cation:proton antiporter [Opitutales bacterium]MCH8539685.1 cation:proton antiporter [Opitutales bacterium]